VKDFDFIQVEAQSQECSQALTGGSKARHWLRTPLFLKFFKIEMPVDFAMFRTVGLALN
jgi:hypothetical protein